MKHYGRIGLLDCVGVVLERMGFDGEQYVDRKSVV